MGSGSSTQSIWHQRCSNGNHSGSSTQFTWHQKCDNGKSGKTFVLTETWSSMWWAHFPRVHRDNHQRHLQIDKVRPHRLLVPLPTMMYQHPYIGLSSSQAASASSYDDVSTSIHRSLILTWILVWLCRTRVQPNSSGINRVPLILNYTGFDVLDNIFAHQNTKLWQAGKTVVFLKDWTTASLSYSMMAEVSQWKHSSQFFTEPRPVLNHGWHPSDGKEGNTFFAILY